MKLRELETELSRLRSFVEPKIEWEQYPTSAHLAARMIHTAEESFGDVEGRSVCDLGCGAGMLIAAAALTGAEYVVGVDIDADVLPIAAVNLDDLGVEADLMCADIGNFPWRNGCDEDRLPPPVFDTVVMNPPFGTRARGIDMVFLRKALDLASCTVYSLHKTSTRDHIYKKAAEWKVTASVLAEMRFDVPKMYKFHSKSSKDIATDFWRFEHATKRLN